MEFLRGYNDTVVHFNRNNNYLSQQVTVCHMLNIADFGVTVPDFKS